MLLLKGQVATKQPKHQTTQVTYQNIIRRLMVCYLSRIKLPTKQLMNAACTSRGLIACYLILTQLLNSMLLISMLLVKGQVATKQPKLEVMMLYKQTRVIF